eukprot:CAMPEP_0116850934 /NCGR_PEP_ID=MMETSP0418-20121206/16435_1 /TAXON_ID=1158023 /ORGANISM="Astrosyne radiata, Strain 13vi08-1A" /LENGTH=282 /DNA_ID=CAMNT_0004482885 /DNA_START=15 /DNA_END=863 /DNA_ORIENTATION=-
MMKKKRRVRFSENIATVVECPSSLSTPQAEKTALWFQSAELIHIRQEGIGLGLSVAHQRHIQTLNPISYSNVIQRTYVACLNGGVPTEQDMQCLAQWTSACPSRRGLEKVCVPKVTRDRIRRIHYNIEAVLSIQDQLQRGPLPYKDRAELLRRASQLVSNSAAVYARVRGITDALAVESDAAVALFMDVSSTTPDVKMTDVDIAPAYNQKRTFEEFAKSGEANKPCWSLSIQPNNQKVCKAKRRRVTTNSSSSSSSKSATNSPPPPQKSAGQQHSPMLVVAV